MILYYINLDDYVLHTTMIYSIKVIYLDFMIINL